MFCLKAHQAEVNQHHIHTLKIKVDVMYEFQSHILIVLYTVVKHVTNLTIINVQKLF